MGHTNSTANLSLPQFIGTDKPTWLGDVNGAFGAIDTAVGTINADILAVDAKADNAVADASSAVTVANNASTTAGNASTTATTANNIANNALTVANNADGHTNQLELKVGLLADLTTTDKTSIVNAINEVNGKDAGDIAYDNSGSGLTATNVQDAIDELAQGSGSGTVSVTGDGVKTYAQLLNELYALIDASKISHKSYLEVNQSGNVTFGSIVYKATGDFRFVIDSVSRLFYKITSASELKQFAYSTATETDVSNIVATSAESFTIHY